MEVADNKRQKKISTGTALARVGLLILAMTVVVAAFFDHILWFYPFIAAIAVGLIMFGLLLNVSARENDRD